MPDHAHPHPTPSGAWPENFTSHRGGTNCPMCVNDFAADDIGWGLLLRRGEVSNAYLWRRGRVRGYAVVIYTGRHVAEPTKMDEGEAAAFWRAVVPLGRAVETLYEPLKMNYLLLGNRIPLHAYSLTVPAVAARVRHEFADILDTPAGRAGELVALGQLLQACSRGVHPRLAPLIAHRAEHLTGVPVPTP
ncbi:hypothetical protein [Streptomyces sp. NPDC056160]|uniref:hypothetical protein n=1 Tax=Streptomyces sp. NPDC056160 TaxID=3345731 RepID=UPI0035D63F84